MDNRASRNRSGRFGCPRKLRSGLEEIFAAPTDLLHVIQWKELYELLEAATDKAEDVADLIEGIVLQNA